MLHEFDRVAITTTNSHDTCKIEMSHLPVQGFESNSPGAFPGPHFSIRVLREVGVATHDLHLRVLDPPSGIVAWNEGA